MPLESVVVEMGRPRFVTSDQSDGYVKTAPDESRKVTTAPGIACGDTPASTARPDRVPEQSATVGAETAMLLVAYDSVDPPDDPSARAVKVAPARSGASTGPGGEGQTAIAVTSVHNCGAEPIAVILACTVTAPDASTSSTSKLGVWPVEATVRLERSCATFAAIGTDDQLEIASPDEFLIVNLADVKPEVGAVIRNDLHPPIAVEDEQPILGTEAVPEKIAFVGASAEHPSALFFRS